MYSLYLQPDNVTNQVLNTIKSVYEHGPADLILLFYSFSVQNLNLNSTNKMRGCTTKFVVILRNKMLAYHTL